MTFGTLFSRRVQKSVVKPESCFLRCEFGAYYAPCPSALVVPIGNGDGSSLAFLTPYELSPKQEKALGLVPRLLITAVNE